MSVINKMLRDLDHRQVQPDVTGTTDALRQQGVASVPRSTRQTRSGARWGWVLLLLLLVVVAAGWWQWQQMQTPVSVVAPPAPTTAAMVPLVAASASEAVAAPPSPPAQEVLLEAAAPPPPAPPAQGLRMETTLSSSPAAVVQAPGVAPPKVAVAVATQPTVPTPTPVVAEPPKKNPPVVSSPVAPAPAAPPAADTANLAQRQQQAARETLAQAQALWNSGARENAITLLQDAVAAAERALQTNASAANSQTLVSMLRELARMELAEGRAAAVWELLTRLEPMMVNQPELWALRANAAQRLGRHQDSVQAYTTALQSRPNEQRWLLGAAVSLAALGQTGAAGDMAEKARAVGLVSKEVLIYLRQQGVPLADR